jgi:hemerythrin superfamily protein
MQTDVNQLPARGNDAVEILVNDHHVVKTLLNRLCQAGGDSERTACVEQLVAVFTVHNATEENLVYPAIHKIANRKSEAEHLYHETAEADTMLFELDTMLKTGETSKFQEKAEKYREAVLKHVAEEEDKAFPRLQEGADPQQARLLTESVREFRSKVRMAGAAEAARTETGEIPRI